MEYNINNNLYDRKTIANKAVEKIKTTLNLINESGEYKSLKDAYSWKNIKKQALSGALMGGSIGVGLGGLNYIRNPEQFPPLAGAIFTGTSTLAGALAGATLGPAFSYFSNKIFGKSK